MSGLTTRCGRCGFGHRVEVVVVLFDPTSNGAERVHHSAQVGECVLVLGHEANSPAVCLKRLHAGKQGFDATGVAFEEIGFRVTADHQVMAIVAAIIP